MMTTCIYNAQSRFCRILNSIFCHSIEFNKPSGHSNAIVSVILYVSIAKDVLNNYRHFVFLLPHYLFLSPSLSHSLNLTLSNHPHMFGGKWFPLHDNPTIITSISCEFSALCLLPSYFPFHPLFLLFVLSDYLHWSPTFSFPLQLQVVIHSSRYNMRQTPSTNLFTRTV